MTCAKKTVTCLIMCLNGTGYFGTNDCNNPQTECPRLKGEGYEKCKSVCQQDGHAEEVAVSNALSDNADLNGAIASISGIDHFCKSCQKKLYANGIRNLYIGEQT